MITQHMKIITYQAVISNPDSVAHVQATKQAVERIGGKVTLHQATRVGLIAVILELPESHRPEDFFPGLPFYPL